MKEKKGTTLTPLKTPLTSSRSPKAAATGGGGEGGGGGGGAKSAFEFLERRRFDDDDDDAFLDADDFDDDFDDASEESSSSSEEKETTMLAFLSNVVKLLETRDGIDKTLKTIKYGAVLSALMLTTRRNDERENHYCYDQSRRAEERERSANRLRKLAKSLSISRGSLRVGKFLKFSMQCREHLVLCVASRSPVARSSRRNTTNAEYRRHALEFLAYFMEAAYYFLEQGVWLQNVGAFRSDDPVKRKELKQLALRVEFFMYATSIPLRVAEWRDIRRMEKAARVEEKNEADACEKNTSTSKRFLSFISSPQKTKTREEIKRDLIQKDEMEFAKANAVKSIAKDSLDLVLVTSDLDWIRERRVRDAIANEWVYSALSLSSALISISKLWAKTLRV